MRPSVRWLPRSEVHADLEGETRSMRIPRVPDVLERHLISRTVRPRLEVVLEHLERVPAELDADEEPLVEPVEPDTELREARPALQIAAVRLQRVAEVRDADAGEQIESVRAVMTDVEREREILEVAEG